MCQLVFFSMKLLISGIPKMYPFFLRKNFLSHRKHSTSETTFFFHACLSTASLARRKSLVVSTNLSSYISYLHAIIDLFSFIRHRLITWSEMGKPVTVITNKPGSAKNGLLLLRL